VDGAVDSPPTYGGDQCCGEEERVSEAPVALRRDVLLAPDADEGGVADAGEEAVDLLFFEPLLRQSPSPLGSVLL